MAPITTGADEAMDVEGRLWLSRDGKNLGGRGRIELLARIAESGSISQAAKAMGMGYKSAWDAVDAMNNAAGELLVARSVGGRGGGGARLTAAGEKLVATFRHYEEEHARFLQRLSADAQPYIDMMERLTMRTSARNQFFGHISAIHTGAVNDEIELTVAGGDRIVAVITRESTESLALQLGSEAFALVKASWVILAAADDNLRTSARNTLRGRVERIERGAVNSEVILQLQGGTALVAIVTNASVDALGLQPGGDALALIKASHVIVGVPA
jgi:molybdate transport system regulatory protein